MSVDLIPDSERFKENDRDYIKKLNEQVIDRVNAIATQLNSNETAMQQVLELGADLESLVGGDVATEADVKKATDLAIIGIYL